jgi:hypothetical protein
MANGEFIEVLSPTALADLNSLNAELVKTVASVTQINQMMGSTPSGNTAAIANMNKAYQDQTVIIQNLQRELARLQQTKSGVNAKTSEEIVNQRILAQNADNVARSNSNLVGSYQKLSIAYNNQKKAALDLGATYGLQSKQFTDAAAKANAMSQELKALDAQVGVNNRNVGNYGNAFTNALSGIYSKIRIIAYILPGLGIGGIFGFIFEGITMLASKFDFVEKSITRVKEAFGYLSDEVKLTRNAMADASKEGAKNAVEEQTNVKILLATAKDHTLTYKERMIAVQELQKQYPYYFENLTKEQILAGETTKEEKKLNDALLARAKTQAAVSKLTAIAALEIDAQIELAKVSDDVTKAKKKQADGLKNLTVYSSEADRQRLVSDSRTLQSEKDKQAALEKKIKGYKDAEQALLKFATEEEKKSVGLGYKPEKEKKEKPDKRKDIESIEITKAMVEGNDSLYYKLIANKKALEDGQKALANNTEEWKKWQFQIDAVQLALDLLMGKETVLDKDMQANAKKATQEFVRLYSAIAKTADASKKVDLKANMEVFNKYVGDFMAKAGFSQTFDILFKQQKSGITLFETLTSKTATTADKTKAMFETISGAAQDAFNLIEKSQISNYENEKTRLSNQKDIALSFAGDSAAAKLKIEKEYQAQLREINHKEAVAKKESAMFNIAIDTAQAVMAVAADAQVWEIPVMIALGALQEALVASQKLPAYFTGTNNAIGGMAWTDERGAEIHTDKFGNIKDFGSDAGARLKYLEKGDKVFNAMETKKILNGDSFDGDLSRILTSRGISNPIIINKGLNKAEMDELLKKHIGSQSQQNIRFDRNGFSSYISKNGNITRRSENRGSGIGRSI